MAKRLMAPLNKEFSMYEVKRVKKILPSSTGKHAWVLHNN